MTQATDESICIETVKPKAGDRYRHFRQQSIYKCLGVASHGQITASLCLTGVYEPLMELVRVVELQDGSLIYQFPLTPDRNLGEMVIYSTGEGAMPWLRCLPNFVETIVYHDKEVQRFTLV